MPAFRDPPSRADPVDLLDDPGRRAKLDPQGMGAVLECFADDVRAGAALAERVRLDGLPPRALVLLGMGGSAIAGDLLAALWREHAPFPVHVVRGYGLPAWIGPDSLVVASSYSGETEETLSAFEGARQRGSRIVVMTTGGRLGSLATTAGLPRITLPAGFPPRAALPYSLAPLVALLVRAYPALAGAGRPEDAASALAGLGRRLGPDVPSADNPAKQLARWIGDRTPAIYGTDVTAAVAQRWRSQMEENAKRLALAGELPEMNHNAIEPWGRRPPTAPGPGWALLLLRDAGEHPRVARRAVLTMEVAGEGTPAREVWSAGESRLARLLSLVLIGDWVSYYLALAAGVDPWPVATLDAFKRRL